MLFDILLSHTKSVQIANQNFGMTTKKRKGNNKSEPFLL